ncbi:DUF1684 domain-containing protein [Pseudonocardia endophytica]|uniref:DUF1684 domain-containing protein n=1 Tax=Pseudonocardia endophytica TaxID=401976 RepID=A0A4R1HIA7_PSEEN|nr:DUF1684 domain-containing protein [Pseudonocardia endophytica]TCK21528.1 hypothetical protein EV378_5516 [Pseudonocardia endophytica]
MTTTEHDLRTTWQAWHDEREQWLQEPHGWLSITALHWLTSEPTEIAGLPGTWRVRDADTVELSGVTAEDEVRLDDRPVGGSVGMQPVDGLPGVMVSVGDKVVEIARRTDDYALRVRDPQAITRTAFSGVPVFPVDESWVVTGRFTPYDEPETITVDAVVAGLHHYPTVVGTVEFELGGATQTLRALPGKDGGLGLHFRDATSGQETYGGGRILRVDDPGADGTLVIDLNRTVNLPCAFIAHATCPLPPAGNTVTVPVEAGERTPLRPDLA